MFEAKPVTGGTLAFHNSDGSSLFPYNDREQDPITAEDVAGTALVWNNALFTRDSQKVLGDKVYFTESGSQSVSFYDGTHEKAVTSRPYREMAMGTWLSLLLSYGPSVWRANSLIEGGRLREAMLKAPMTLDAEAVFSSMGILEYVRQSSTTGLKDAGISKQYADQILDPQVRRIYGQGVGQVTNLALMLAAAQEDSANAYEGGNLIDRLNHIVREIGVDVRTSTRVNLVSREMIAENRYTWLVRYESTNARDGVGGDQDDSSVGLEAFDKIIVASYDWKMELLNREARVHSLTSFQDMHADDSNPQSDSDFDFDPSDFDLGAEATTRPPRDYPFVPAHIVFFTTKERIRDQADQVLFEGNKGIREFSFVRDILRYRDFPATVETEYLYRVLSQSPVLDGLQKKYPITWSYQIRIENGFSLSRPLSKMPMFECLWDEDLWWTSVIQHAWNSVDSNWLAGKIVAEDLVQRVLREAT
ncbi:hypothetical protein GGS20DRAFT_284935 [Poronia punctata]|nr:hypothetical protein GGS20DRAFT_284935 [Poronia punctata]